MQNSFDFGHRPQYIAEDFFVTESNRNAYTLVCRYPEWEFFCVFVAGAEGSGKTHLSKVWLKAAEANGGVANIDIETQNGLNEVKEKNLLVSLTKRLSKSESEALFHIYNYARENGKFLLITSVNEIDELTNLPDLASRLKIANIVRLEQPDDDLVKMILFKEFSDRQMKVSRELVEYLAKRIERSGKVIKKTIEFLEANSVKKELTIRLASRLLKF